MTRFDNTRRLSRVEIRLRTIVCVLSLTILLVASVASADIIHIQGNSALSTEGLGNFSGTIEYSSVDPMEGTLVINLTNTSPPANGGFITGFVLNNPGGITDLTLTSAPGSFLQLGLGDNSINAQPFGLFDLGAALGGSFQGGGNPNPGIPVDETEEFLFTLVGSLSGLSTEDFLNTDSEPQGNSGTAAFVVRFRGFQDGGSDKVPGGTIAPPPQTEPPQAVPEPGSIAIWSLLTMAAIGIAYHLSRQPHVRRAG